jgi:ATP-dependent 26S proteasome regulatory subunit
LTQLYSEDLTVVIEIPLPDLKVRRRLLTMTLSAIAVSPEVDFYLLAKTLDGCSSADVVMKAQCAAKYCVLEGGRKVEKRHFEIDLAESFAY